MEAPKIKFQGLRNPADVASLVWLCLTTHVWEPNAKETCQSESVQLCKPVVRFNLSDLGQAQSDDLDILQHPQIALQVRASVWTGYESGSYAPWRLLLSMKVDRKYSSSHIACK